MSIRKDKKETKVANAANGDRKVYKEDMVKVKFIKDTYIGKQINFKKGKEIEVHRVQAERFLAQNLIEEFV